MTITRDHPASCLDISGELLVRHLVAIGGKANAARNPQAVLLR
jgi:hypothetical protein